VQKEEGEEGGYFVINHEQQWGIEKDPIGRGSRDLMGGLSAASIQPSFSVGLSFSLPSSRGRRGGVAREEICWL